MHAGSAVNGLVFSGPAGVAGDHTIQWSNRVTNKAEADRIIRRWAKLLNEHLAEVQSATSNK